MMNIQFQRLLCTIIVFCLLTPFSQTIAEEVPTVWKIVSMAKAEPVEAALGKTFILKKDGTKIQFCNLKKEEVAVGTIKNKIIEAKFVSPTEPYSFKAKLLGNKIDGTIMSATGHAFSWKATKLGKLGSMWVCKNHNPAHVAWTPEEMKNYTQKEKCKDWHRAR